MQLSKALCPRRLPCRPWPETEPTGLDFLRAHLQTPPPPPERAFVWQGGETAGLKRLQHYLSGPVFTYKQTRNNFLGENFSSRLSPYLALGCLSPRQVYALLREAEKQHGANESTYWLFFELLWREYFRWLLKKEKGRFFAAGGLRDMHIPWQQDEKLFTAWVEGRTGYPIVDAAMRELRATAWTSNRARQIVASVFTKNLLMDWRWGASYFETALHRLRYSQQLGKLALSGGGRDRWAGLPVVRSGAAGPSLRRPSDLYQDMAARAAEPFAHGGVLPYSASSPAGRLSRPYCRVAAQSPARQRHLVPRPTRRTYG